MDTGELAVGRSISPELVLVDPELAAEARAALPARPWPPVPRIEVERAAPAPARRRRPFAGFGFLAGGLAAGLLLVGLSVLPAPDRPTFAAPADEIVAGLGQQPPPVTRPRADRRAPTAKPKVTNRAARPVPRRSVTTTTQTTTRAPRPATQRPRPTGETRRRTPQAPPSAPPTPPSRRPAPVRVKPAPSFGWAPLPGALYYHARFLRNGKEIYETRTPVPRLRLPARIRFTPGRYRWIVRPAIRSDTGTRLGAPIVDSTFLVEGD